MKKKFSFFLVVLIALSMLPCAAGASGFLGQYKELLKDSGQMGLVI